MTVRLHPEADFELQAAAQWYERRRSGLGEQFLSEAVDALLAIERHPERFARPPYRTRRNVRRCMLEHFPYSLVYEIRDTECVVAAVAHAARRPGYWQGRLD